MRVFFPATLVALATLVCLSSGFAQEGGARPATAVPKTAAAVPNGTNVAVIDIAFIFKKNIRFNSQMKQLESEALEFQGWMQERERALQAMKELLKDFKPGTPEFQKHEEKLANEGTQYQLDVRRRQQEVSQKEAAIYYDSYADMEKTVTLFAQRNRIGIVLKFDREAANREDRNSVMRSLARPVVYQAGLDISTFILGELNKGQVEPAPTTKPSVQGGGSRTADKPTNTKKG